MGQRILHTDWTEIKGAFRLNPIVARDQRIGHVGYVHGQGLHRGLGLDFIHGQVHRTRPVHPDGEVDGSLPRGGHDARESGVEAGDQRARSVHGQVH